MFLDLFCDKQMLESGEVLHEVEVVHPMANIDEELEEACRAYHEILFPDPEKAGEGSDLKLRTAFKAFATTYREKFPAYYAAITIRIIPFFLNIEDDIM